MQLRLGTLSLLAAAGLLAGCSGPAFESQRVFDEASGAKPSGDAYHQALYSGYMEHATYEQEDMMNYTSAISHSQNAIRASRGETPAVAGVTDFGPQPADKVDELTQARNQLTAALGDTGAQQAPEAAGLAQTYYACWVEQQHENFQPKDIAYCRDGFYKNLKILNDAVVPVAPEVSSLQADAFFDFDKYAIRPDAKPELDRIADVMIADTSTQFLVWGFTDTVGTAEYNLKLSERRADAVADYLVSKGVSRDRLVTKGFGKTNLAVETPDQTPEPRNRRVEIRRR
jgi:OmpA-OmpF porin, OOP family